MDCTDIVMGVARGNLSRVFDMYTRDRSTPRPDEFYGGRDDLSAAFAYEEDGHTVVLFRKPLLASELTDQPLEDTPTLVIWARGQEHGDYVHLPKTGLDEGRARVLDFYRQDEVKYHGHRDQRGSTTLNFYSRKVSKDLCRGEWSHPPGCRAEQCLYSITWNVNPRSEKIDFEVRSTSADKWTGVGFSEDRRMPKTDAIIGWAEKTGRFYVYDMWLPGYGDPINDVHSDVFNVTGQYDAGVVTLRFSRKLDTGDDANDLGFTEDRCLHLVFPVWGGTYNSVLRKLGRHARSPHVSKHPLCLQGCRPPPPPPETPPPIVSTSLPPSPPTSSERPVTDVRGESSDACTGSWRFPESCAGDSCEYMASWSYHGPSDQVLFTVSTRSNKWTGIGFSSNKKMPKTDAILGWVEETGRFFIMDVWMDGYEAPFLDPVQDVGNMSGSRQDGRTTLSFARRRYSGDAMYDLDLDQCLYLVFPTHGGVFNAVSKKIRHHEQTPLVSREPVCFMHCHPGASVPTGPPVPETRATSAPSTVAPPLEEYRVKLQLLEPWQASYGVKGSRPFTLLNRQLVDGLEPALNEVVQKHQLRLTRITREPNGLLAEMRLLLAADAEPTEVAQALQAALQPGLLGAVRVNPSSLTVHSSNAPESRPKQSAIPGVPSGSSPDSSQAKLYAVVAAVAALVLLLLVQAAAMACRRKRQPQPPAPNREKLLASSHWKDYSTTASSNYSYENFALRAEDDLGPPAGAPHRPASATYERGSTAAVRPQANPYATTQRTQHQPQELNPDFYFMPHQRRYSGEVVRVFVDYSNPEYTGGAK